MSFTCKCLDHRWGTESWHLFRVILIFLCYVLHDLVEIILIPKRAQNASSNVFCNIRQSSLFNIKMFIIMFSMIYQLNRVSRDTVSPPLNSNICHCECALLVIADCFPCKLFQNSFIYFTEKEHWLTSLHSF